MSGVEATVALIISVTTAIGSIINALHVQNCQSLCCTSDCTAPKETKELKKPPTRQDLANMMTEIKSYINTQPSTPTIEI
jgi:thiamine phosphate synthase YjbQ (UPF0047 family)